MWAIVGALSCLGLEGYQILTNVYKLTNVRIMWTILNLGKKMIFKDPPHLGPYMGKKMIFKDPPPLGPYMGKN